MTATLVDTKGRQGKPAEPADSAEKKRKARAQRPFPACSFEEALEFAKSVSEFASGQPVRRLSFFDHLGKSPESGASRQLITNAGKYGLTTGSYKADQLELTPIGQIAVSDEMMFLPISV